MNFKDKIMTAKGKKLQLEETLNKKEEQQKVLKKRLDNLVLVQAFFQKVAKETQEKIIIHIEDIVNLALQTCFPNEFKFVMNFEIKRGKTEAKLYLEDKKGNEIDILSGTGGGVVDIISFALRIAVWTISRAEPVIVLDEPFRFLSNDLQDKAGLILQELSGKLGIQFIIITHNEKLMEFGDKLYYVKKIKNYSKVEEIKN